MNCDNGRETARNTFFQVFLNRDEEESYELWSMYYDHLTLSKEHFKYLEKK